jgi:hypothetical protein
MLMDAVDSGFLCGSALTRDSSFKSLHSHPRFADVLQLADHKRHQVHAAFLAADGQDVLAISR